METICALLAPAALGTVAVVYGAHLLLMTRWFGSASLALRLPVSYGIILVSLISYAPIYILQVRGTCFGDVYVPYLFVPGIIVYAPVSRVGLWVFPAIVGHFDPFAASVICIILLPGALSLIVGSLVWWTFGAIVVGGKRWVTNRPRP